MAKNYPKLPKMTQNSPKWSEMFRQMVQMRQGIPTPNYLTQNGGKLSKKLKLAKMTLKWPKMTKMAKIMANFFSSFRDPQYYLKTYLDTKFQLIWPTNRRQNQKDSLVGQKNHF